MVLCHLIIVIINITIIQVLLKQSSDLSKARRKKSEPKREDTDASKETDKLAKNTLPNQQLSPANDREHHVIPTPSHNARIDQIRNAALPSPQTPLPPSGPPPPRPTYIPSSRVAPTNSSPLPTQNPLEIANPAARQALIAQQNAKPSPPPRVPYPAANPQTAQPGDILLNENSLNTIAKPLKNQNEINKGDIVIVQRNGPPRFYQFVRILEKKSDTLVFDPGDGIPTEKAIEVFFKLTPLSTPAPQVPQEKKQELQVRIGEKVKSTELANIAEKGKDASHFKRGDIVIAPNDSHPPQYSFVKILGLQGDKRDEIVFALQSGEIAVIKCKDAYALKVPVAIKIISTEPRIEFTPEEAILDTEGVRTAAMRNFLTRFPDYDAGHKTLNIQNKTYTPVTGNATNFTEQPLVSIGSSSSREVLTLDPKNSPHLAKHYNNLLENLNKLQKQQGRPLDEKQVLDYVMNYVNKNIFPYSAVPDIEKKVDDMVDAKKNDARNKSKIICDNEQVPVIPIDDFIKAGIGVCRHKALVASYLLDRLGKEPKPVIQGIVQQMRDNVTGEAGSGGHIWVTMMSSKTGQKWHIDPMDQVVADFSDPTVLNTLKKHYGASAIENEVFRSNAAIQAKRLKAKPS